MTRRFVQPNHAQIADFFYFDLLKVVIASYIRFHVAIRRKLCNLRNA
jgi:hypothetical protein